jgi:hypothetical protein
MVRRLSPKCQYASRTLPIDHSPCEAIEGPVDGQSEAEGLADVNEDGKSEGNEDGKSEGVEDGKSEGIEDSKAEEFS